LENGCLAIPASIDVDGPALGCECADCHLIVVGRAFIGFEILMINRAAGSPFPQTGFLIPS
jgi:hypothetical protein